MEIYGKLCIQKRSACPAISKRCKPSITMRSKQTSCYSVWRARLWKQTARPCLRNSISMVDTSLIPGPLCLWCITQVGAMQESLAPMALTTRPTFWLSLLRSTLPNELGYFILKYLTDECFLKETLGVAYIELNISTEHKALDRISFKPHI